MVYQSSSVTTGHYVDTGASSRISTTWSASTWQQIMAMTRNNFLRHEADQSWARPGQHPNNFWKAAPHLFYLQDALKDDSRRWWRLRFTPLFHFAVKFEVPIDVCLDLQTQHLGAKDYSVGVIFDKTKTNQEGSRPRALSSYLRASMKPVNMLSDCYRIFLYCVPS